MYCWRAGTVLRLLAQAVWPQSMVSASSATISMSGTASDNAAVSSVRWTTSTGGPGAATGTTSWCAVIPLLVGNNTVRAGL